MQVGMLLEPVKRWPGDSRPLVELYDEAISTVQWLEDIGLDFILFGEHHFLPNQWSPSTLMLLAGVATRTSRIGIGTSVLLTPLYKDAIRLAEDIATLDLLSNGRMIPVFGAGSTTHEFRTFGIDPDTRFGRMFEVMQFVRRCFDGPEAFDHHGKHFEMIDVRMTTQPVQRPIPIYFGGMGLKNSHRAGELGFHCACNIGAYLQGLQTAGDDPSAFNVLGLGGGMVAATSADVQIMRQELTTYARLNYEEYMIDPATRRDLGLPAQLLESPGPFESSIFAAATPVVGTPDEVLATCASSLETSNITHLVGGMPTTYAVHWINDHKASVELYAKEVLPVLRTWGRDPVAGPGSDRGPHR